jgi:riboflavin biosynthesis pyrimidine reductase
LRPEITCNAASSANGEIARSTSADTAASMRVLLKALHPFSLDGST